MSDYLNFHHLFEAQVDRGVLSHRSAELNQLISDIENYINLKNGGNLLAVKHSFDNWRVQDPKEFANRSRYGEGKSWLDSFTEELNAASLRYHMHLEDDHPGESNYQFSTPPAAVVNRHRLLYPYWAAQYLQNLLGQNLDLDHLLGRDQPVDLRRPHPDLVSRHSKVKKAAVRGMQAANVGISASQAAVHQAGIATLVVGAGAVTSATGVGLIAAGAVLTLVQCGLAIRSFQKTHKHLMALHYLQDHRNDDVLRGCQVRGGGGEARAEVHRLVADHVLPYIILQKHEKLARKAASGFLPIVGSLAVSAATAGRNIASRLRGTLGVNRYKAAHWLAAHFCERQCLLTDLMVASLYSLEEMIELHFWYDYEETADLLAAKMKSI